MLNASTWCTWCITWCATWCIIVSVFVFINIPTSTRRNIGWMSVHRLQRWPNIQPTLLRCLIFTGMVLSQEQYGLIMPSAAGYWMVGHSYETAGCLCQSPPLSMIRVTDSPVNVLDDWQEADCPYGWSHHDRACYRCVYGDHVEWHFKSQTDWKINHRFFFIFR